MELEGHLSLPSGSSLSLTYLLFTFSTADPARATGRAEKQQQYAIIDSLLQIELLSYFLLPSSVLLANRNACQQQKR